MLSALGKPSIALDFKKGCRRQVIGTSLQPGGVMRCGILHEVDDESSLNLAKAAVNAHLRSLDIAAARSLK